MKWRFSAVFARESGNGQVANIFGGDLLHFDRDDDHPLWGMGERKDPLPLRSLLLTLFAIVFEWKPWL